MWLIAGGGCRFLEAGCSFTVRRVDVGLGGVEKLVGSGAAYPKVQ